MRTAPVQRSLADDIGRLVLRVTVSGLILFHGIDKIVHGIGWMRGPLQSLHLPFFIAYGAYAGEVVGPLLVLAGVLTRIGALLMAFNMVMALVLEAGPLILIINQTGGWGVELEAFYLLNALTVFILGSGRFGIMAGKGRWA